MLLLLPYQSISSVSLKNDCIGCTWACLMKSCNQIALTFELLDKMIETKFEANVNVLRSDNGSI